MATLPASPSSDDTGRWTLKHVRLLAIIMLINVIDGLDFQLLPLSLVTIANAWQLQPNDFAVPVSLGFVGSALGTPIGGWLGDRRGRKPAILSGVALFGIMTIVMAFCDTIWQLSASRLLSGVGLGICLPPMLALVIESVPVNKRGTAVALTMLSMPLGLTLSGFVIPRVSDALGWQSSFLICGFAVIVVWAIAWMGLPEAPKTLARLPADETAQNTPTEEVALDRFLRGIDRTTAFAFMGSMMLVYVIMSVALSWLAVFTQQAGHSATVAGQAVSAWSAAGMVGTLLAGALVNRFGGKKASKITICGLGLAAAISGLGLANFDGSATVLYCAAALTGIFSNGSITVIYAAASECFAQNVRSTGMAAVNLSGKSGGIIGGASGALLQFLPNLAALFIMLAGIGILAWLILLKTLGPGRSATPH